MKLKNIALVTGLLCSVVAAPANSATLAPNAYITVNVNGKNYDITTIVGSYTAHSAELSNGPWFGDLNNARSFSNAVNTQLGTPNNSSEGVYFLYDANARVAKYLPTFNNTIVSTVSSTTSYTYAIVAANTSVPEPLNVLGSIVGLAMLGTVSSRLKKRT